MRALNRAALLSLGDTVDVVARMGTVMLLARAFSAEEVGAYRQVLMVVQIAQVLAFFHPADSLYYFLPRAAPAERRGLVLRTAVFALATGVLATCVLVLLSEPIARQFQNSRLPELLHVYGLVLPALVLMTCLRPVFVWTNRLVTSTAIQVGAAVLRLAVVAWVLAHGADLRQLFGLVLSVQGLAAAALFASALAFLGGPPRWPRSPTYLEQARYSVPLNIGAFVGTLKRYVDGLAISIAFTPERYAVYALGATELPFISVIPGAIATAIMPNLSQAVHEGRYRDAYSTFRESSRLAALVMMPIFFLALVNADQIVVVLFSDRFRESTGIFIVFLFLLPLRVAIYGSMLRAFGKTHWILRAHAVGLAVHAAISFLSVTAASGPIAFYGPAVSSVVSTYLIAAILTWAIRNETPQEAGSLLPVRDILRIVFAAAVAGLLAGSARWLVSGPPLAVLVVSGLIFVPVFAVVGRLTGAIQRSDVDSALGLLRSRFGGRGG